MNLRAPASGLALFLTLVLGLAGCADTQETIGLPPSPDDDGQESAVGILLTGSVVTDGDLVPREGAVVRLEPVIEDLALSVWETIEGEDVALARRGPTSLATVSDRDGRYRFEDVDPGSYLVRADAADHLGGFEEILVEPLPAAAMAGTLVVDVALTPTGTIAGTVLLENETSHENTVVYVRGTSYVGVTGEFGQYEIYDVPVGQWILRATQTGYLDRVFPAEITGAGDVAQTQPTTLLIDSNIPPTAEAGGPYAGFAGVPITLAGTGADLDGDVVRYEWDFDGNGVFDSDAATGSIDATFPNEGTYQVKLRVTDDRGAIGLDVADVQVGATAIYVSATAGNDGNEGSSSAPVATLAQAYVLAQQAGFSEIRMAIDNYPEVPNFVAGIDVIGGYSYPDWTPDLGPSDFLLGASPATATGITDSTTIRNIYFTSTATGVNQNSIAMLIRDSSANLFFEQCRFRSAVADAGSSGSGGANGEKGANGAPGTAGSCDGPNGFGGAGGFSLCGCTGGAGGRGGLEGANNGVSGSPGGCGGGSGGLRGVGGTTGSPGSNGSAGAPGAQGPSGNPASPAGTIANGLFKPDFSGNGSSGSCGRGGGGGGGGGGQGGTFVNNGGGNGGGGGGGGGQGGFGGSGGEGGWGSFAVYLIDSSPTITDCSIEPRRGGAGGTGGFGGNGGGAGLGAAGAGVCTAEVGRGGKGGDGGQGGRGGGGAGGPGGPSFGIYRVGASNPALNGNVVFDPPLPGAGGAGGSPNGPAGAPGLSGNIN